MKNFLQPTALLKKLVFHNFFSKVSGNCILGTSKTSKHFLTKTTRCLYAEFHEFSTNCKDKQNHIFPKCKSYKISSTVIYMGEDREFIIHVFYWCTPLYHEIYIKCKKKSNLIKGISSHNIYCGIKSQQVKEIFCHSVLKNFDFSQNSSFPFH